MAATSKELYDMAMALGDKGRAELSGMLLQSLEIVPETGVEASRLEEVERRIQELDTGKVRSVPWSEVRSRVFEPRAD